MKNAEDKMWVIRIPEENGQIGRDSKTNNREEFLWSEQRSESAR